MNHPLLYVALDYDTPEEALSMAEKLNTVEGNFGYKLNGDLLLKYGLDTIDEFKELERPIFADLKIWKGRGTMGAILDTLMEKGIEHTNVYAHAGEEYLGTLTDKIDGSNLNLLALTVLTHYDEEYSQRIHGKPLEDTVRTLAETAYESGCDGLVLPPTCLAEVKDLEMENLTPGIRPSWYLEKHDNYQKQVATPREAVKDGSDVLVMGSPIRKDKKPREALRKTLKEMEVKR